MCMVEIRDQSTPEEYELNVTTKAPTTIYGDNIACIVQVSEG